MSMLTTITGASVNLFNPDPTTIRPYDIAHALSYTNRYNGHTMAPYSTGQHTLAIVDYLERKGEPDHIIAVGLIHDLPEYVLGDVTSPLKAIIGPQYKRLEATWEDAICTRFDSVTGDDYRMIYEQHVKHADNLAYLTEARMLTNHHIPDPLDEVMHECFMATLHLPPAEVTHQLLGLIKKYLQ